MTRYQIIGIFFLTTNFLVYVNEQNLKYFYNNWEKSIENLSIARNLSKLGKKCLKKLVTISTFWDKNWMANFP